MIQSTCSAHQGGAAPTRSEGYSLITLRFSGVVPIAIRTVDPDVVIGEFTYRGDAGWAAPCIVVLRVRDGLIVESRDYIDHLALARARNTVDALCAQLTNA